jgi:hypothetical protein
MRLLRILSYGPISNSRTLLSVLTLCGLAAFSDHYVILLITMNILGYGFAQAPALFGGVCVEMEAER